ncbi:MAG: class I SAM-dependent methyltransferase [Candidatus Ancaeobacter aquaticus]|nr:class I SAM-dependent methyltransferase [Candidatus Ancaeobacter aquaticus]
MKATNYKDKKIVSKYLKKTLSGVYIIYPAILRLLRNVKGKTVLDLGCGAGLISQKLSERGAKVFAVDSSQRWIDICKKESNKTKNIKYTVADADDLSIYKDRKFDIVFANMVFLSVSSKQKVAKSFNEVSRIIKKGGTFIFSDCHPVANMTGSSSTKISGAVPGFSYFKDGAKYRGTYLLSDYSHIEFTDLHFSLGFYSKLLNENGFMIEEIIEPKPAKMDPEKRFKNYRIPEYIIFKCRKL